MPLPLQHLASRHASRSLCWPSFVTSLWPSPSAAGLVLPWYQPLISNLRHSITVYKKAFTCIILFHLHGICYGLQFMRSHPTPPYHSYFEILVQCDGIRRQGRWEVLSSRGWSTHARDPCLRRVPQSPTPLLLCEDTAARLIYQPASMATPGHQLLMHFQTPEPGGIRVVGSRRSLGLVATDRGD